MTLNEKASYIKGLCDGLELDTNTKEGKLISVLIDMVSDMAKAISELEEDVDTAFDYCEELDEDLGAVEEMLLEDDCDCDCDCDDYDDFECDGNCDLCDEECELDDEEYFEVDCPACGETICFDGSIDPEELACPACGEKFECIISEDEATDAE